MRIAEQAFKVIYTLITSKIFNEELTESQRHQLKAIDYNLWEVTKPGNDDVNFFDKIFGNLFPPLSRRYFWTKLGAITRDDLFTIPIRDDVLVSTLQYLEITFPAGISIRHTDTNRKKAMILLDELEKIYPALLAEAVNSYPKITDSNDDDIAQIDANNPLCLKNFGWGSNITTYKLHIETIILEYLNLLEDKNFTAAMNMWDDELIKSKWQNNHFNFTLDFIKFQRITNFKVLDIFGSKTTRCFKCIVYYFGFGFPKKGNDYQSLSIITDCLKINRFTDKIISSTNIYEKCYDNADDYIHNYIDDDEKDSIYLQNEVD